jgi:DNA-binding NarL/FixJ family response regulator
VLTSRQRQVLAMLRQSLSNKEIAVALNISEATVKNHVHSLLDKLHVTSRAKAAACLPPPDRVSVRSRHTTEPPLESRAHRS